MSDSTTEGTLLLNSVPDALVWSGRTTAGMVLFALASDCTVSDSTDLTFSSETDLLSKITSFVQVSLNLFCAYVYINWISHRLRTLNMNK